jgi:tetratricopeptide (TPR) repeat protein
MGMDSKRFRQTFTILIAAITVLGGLLAYLSTEANMRSTVANRDSRILAIESLPQEMDALQASSRARRELATQQEIAIMAEVDMLLPIRHEGSPGNQLLNGWLQMLSLSQARSPTLNKELADITISPTADLVGRLADGFVVPQTKLQEEQLAQKRVSTAWSNKGSAYLTGITILAVAIFLLTLSLTISTQTRFFFALVGLGLTLAVVLYGLVTMLTPFAVPTAESVMLLSQASGDYFRGSVSYTANDFQGILEVTKSAIRALDQAIAQSPDFPSAYSLRGKSWSLHGQAEIFGPHDLTIAQSDFQRAISDLETAIRQGQGDFESYLSLGVAQLYAKDYEGGDGSLKKAKELAPRQELLIGLDLAVNNLAWGKPQEAMQAAEEATQFATSNRLYSNSYIFRKIVYLLEQMKTVTPMEGMNPLIKRLKEASVSLEYLNQASPSRTGAKLAPLTFVQEEVGSSGQPVYTATSTFPAFTSSVSLSFDYSDVQPGTLIVQKVYRDWNEQFLLERSEPWNLDSSGLAVWSVSFPLAEAYDYLPSGEYQVELFADGELVSSGQFTVEQPGSGS